MNIQEIKNFEDRVDHLFGINARLHIQINSLNKNNLLNISSENLLDFLDKYLQLPDANRKFSVKKFNTAHDDQYTYRLEFIKLR
jgi:hypothetical protein